MAKKITFVLQPETDFASLGALVKAMEDINKLIRLVDYSATRQRAGRLWAVEQIRSTAPTVTLVPPPGETDAIDIIADGLQQVTELGTDSPPGHFSEETLQHLYKMGRLFKGRHRLNRVSVFVDDEGLLGDPISTIRSDIPSKIAPILRSGYSELSSLEGTMEVINVHRSPTFTIWEQLSGMPVRCTFPNEQGWKDRVMNLLEKPILVEGQVSYFGNGLPRAVSKIDNLLDVTPDRSLLPGDFGTIPDITGDMDTIEYLRTVRGG